MQRPALTSRPVISSLYLFFDVYLPSYISSRKRRLFSISTFGLYDDRDRDSRDQRRENQMKKRWEKSERDTEKSETTDDRKSLSDNKVSHVLMYEGTWFIISKYEMTGKEREATGRRQQRHECGWKGSQRERCKGRKNRWITERELCMKFMLHSNGFLFSSLFFRFPYDVSDTLLTLVMSCFSESLTGSNFGFTLTLLQTEVSFFHESLIQETTKHSNSWKRREREDMETRHMSLECKHSWSPTSTRLPFRCPCVWCYNYNCTVDELAGFLFVLSLVFQWKEMGLKGHRVAG